MGRILIAILTTATAAAQDGAGMYRKSLRRLSRRRPRASAEPRDVEAALPRANPGRANQRQHAGAGRRSLDG